METPRVVQNRKHENGSATDRPRNSADPHPIGQQSRSLAESVYGTPRRGGSCGIDLFAEGLRFYVLQH